MNKKWKWFYIVFPKFPIPDSPNNQIPSKRETLKQFIVDWLKGIEHFCIMNLNCFLKKTLSRQY